MKIMNITINNKLLYILAMLIILPILILLILNLSPANKDMHNINKICKEIEHCNLSLKDCLDTDGLNLNDTENILSTKLIDLNSIKNNLYSLEVNDTEIPTKDELLKIINYNISLYESCLNLIKTPNDKDIISKYNDYSTTYSLYLKCYDTLNSLGVSANIAPETKEFFIKSFNYFGTIIKINRDNDIYVDQKRSYISNLEKCINAFDSIDEDLKPALEKIKEDKRSLDVLLKDIKDKKSKLNEIKNISYSLTIPEGGNECFNLLEDTINYYQLYLTSLDQSIVLEKTSKNINSKDLEDDYNNSFSKYDDFINSFKYLSAELDNFNKK